MRRRRRARRRGRLRASACVRPGMRLARGTEHRHAPAREQRGDAADVIAVMMRREDRRRASSRSRVEIVDAPGAASPGSTTAARRTLANQPDIVVRERGDGDNRRHGCIFGTAARACQPRSPSGSRRRSAAICSRASRRTSTRRSPTSSASTRCRSACPSARSSRRAASSRAGRSTTTRRPTSSPTRTGCRSPENSLDLIVLPHALEFTDDPHLMLREAYRVIRPEGQIVIAGFNPFSLFGAKRYFGRGADAAVERQLHRALPAEGLARAARLRRRRRAPRRLRAAVRARASGCIASGSSRRPATAGGRSPAASISCARPRRCSACACSRPRGSAASGARRRSRPAARAREGLDRRRHDCAAAAASR